jgi:hypothetical protein
VLEFKQKRELEHPARLCIWEMYVRDPGRSLAPKDLRRDMSPTEELRPSVSQVNYQLRRLQLVGLIPER